MSKEAIIERFGCPNGPGWTVRILDKGDAYGLRDCLTADAPLVEFYDRSVDMTREGWERGQFVSRYYLSTLLEDSASLRERGLCLDRGVPSWTLSPSEFCDAFDFMVDWVAEDYNRRMRPAREARNV